MSNGKRQHPPTMPQMSGIQPQMQFSPEAIKSAKEMKCILIDELQQRFHHHMP